MDVEKAIKKLPLKNSCGMDNINGRVIKLCQKALLKPMTHIINLSIETGIFPKAWQVAKVCPVYKSGDRLDVKNYRPIALLPTLSKLLERVISEQVIEHFDRNCLFHDNSNGYRRKKVLKLPC